MKYFRHTVKVKYSPGQYISKNEVTCWTVTFVSAEGCLCGLKQAQEFNIIGREGKNRFLNCTDHLAGFSISIMFCIKTRMYRCESHTVLLLWLPESKPAPQCAAVALAWEGSRDPREDVKGCGYQSRKSCPPLTQPVLIALRKCSHLLFNPINPEIIVKVSGSSYGVFWNWSIVGARNIR